MSREATNAVMLIGAIPAEAATAAFPTARIARGGMERLMAADAATCDLIVIDAAIASPSELSVALATLARTAEPPAVLLVGAALPAVLARALLRLPQTDIIDAPADAISLSLAAQELLAARRFEPAPTPSHCWAVTAAVGGAGATTVAIELAAAIASRGKTPARVALIDMNLADGAAAAYLAVAANLRIGGSSAQRIDAQLLAAFTTETAGGFDLLAASRDPLAFESVDSQAVLRLLDAACQVYDHVIIDLPRQRHAWTLPVLSGCDEVLLVSELTVPALLASRAMAGELEEALGPDRAPKVILNRLAKKVFGPAPSVAEAEKALGRKAAGGLTSDWEAAAAAANLGGPIRRRHPRSRLVKDVADLVEALLAPISAQKAA